MTYADVAVAKRLGGRETIFTYAILPDQLLALAPGVIVEIPWRATTALGMVTGLRRSAPSTAVKSRLKPIKRVLTSWPLLEAPHRLLRAKLAQETLVPASVALTLGLPNAALLKQLTPPAPLTKQPLGTQQFFALQGQGVPPALLAAIRQQIAHHKTVLLLVPTLEDIATWQQALSDLPTLSFSGRLTAAGTRKAWQAALTGAATVLIGTRSAVLLPFRNLGLIVIDRPSHQQFLEEQSPRYSTLRVAKLWHELLGVELALTDYLPPLAILLPNQRRQWTFHRPTAPSPTTHIIARGHESFISTSTHHALERALAQKERSLLVVHQRGWAAGLICQDCHHLFRCLACDSLLGVRQDGHNLTCRVCKSLKDMPERCPACRGARLHQFGIGEERWQQMLQRAYPMEQIETVAADHPPQNTTGIAIWVANSYYLPPVEAGVVVAIEPERFLLQAAYTGEEQWLRVLWQMRARAKELLLIETHVPDHAAFQELSEPLPKQALAHVLRELRTHHFPPFAHLLEVTGPAKLLASLATSIADLGGQTVMASASAGANQRLLAKLPVSCDLRRLAGLPELHRGEITFVFTPAG